MSTSTSNVVDEDIVIELIYALSDAFLLTDKIRGIDSNRKHQLDFFVSSALAITKDLLVFGPDSKNDPQSPKSQDSVANDDNDKKS